MTEAKARLSELARLAHLQHERFTLTRNGRAEAVLLSVDDLEGLERNRAGMEWVTVPSN